MRHCGSRFLHVLITAKKNQNMVSHVPGDLPRQHAASSKTCVLSCPMRIVLSCPWPVTGLNSLRLFSGLHVESCIDPCCCDPHLVIPGQAVWRSQHCNEGVWPQPGKQTMHPARYSTCVQNGMYFCRDISTCVVMIGWSESLPAPVLLHHDEQRPDRGTVQRATC